MVERVKTVVIPSPTLSLVASLKVMGKDRTQKTENSFIIHLNITKQEGEWYETQVLKLENQMKLEENLVFWVLIDLFTDESKMTPNSKSLLEYMERRPGN